MTRPLFFTMVLCASATGEKSYRRLILGQRSQNEVNDAVRVKLPSRLSMDQLPVHRLSLLNRLQIGHHRCCGDRNHGREKTPRDETPSRRGTARHCPPRADHRPLPAIPAPVATSRHARGLPPAESRRRSNSVDSHISFPACRDESALIWKKRNLTNAVVGLQRPDQLPVGCIPETNRLVVTSADKALPVGGEREAHRFGRMPDKRSPILACRRAEETNITSTEVVSDGDLIAAG